MRCRHCQIEWEFEWEHCPSCRRNFGGAIFPAQQTAQELADIDAVADAIRISFRGVLLGDGTTLHEADLEGAYIEESTRRSARDKDSETAWHDVPDWKIERFHSALSFLDEQGWRFYIPAYLTWTLKNWRTSDSATVDRVIDGFNISTWNSFDRYEMLSIKQSRAIYEFLDFFCRYSDEPWAEAAIKSYWGQFSEPER